MNRIRVLIVDDEPIARRGVRLQLKGDPEVEIVGECANGLEAVAAIQKLAPDLVFLDVQMPEMNGFEVVQEIGAERMPAVVFVTAHDQYAIQAFEINALDYLLKPVTEDRFFKALARAKSRLSSNPAAEASRQIIGLLETIASPRRYIKRLAVRSAGKTVFVEAEAIDWMEAAENYVQLHAGRERHLLHVAMNTLEKSLDPENFLRIHRSIIVNIGRIKELQPGPHGEYLVTLHNGIELRSGRTYSNKLKVLAANPF
jgi:two-component system, LytTR family, response regulator